jgi:hypothetical protein
MSTRTRAACAALLFVVFATVDARAEDVPTVDGATPDSDSESVPVESAHVEGVHIDSAQKEAAPVVDTVYFVGLERRDIDDERARLIEDLILTALIARAGIAVRSDASIADALTRAADLQAKGCVDESASCLREVALTLGTRFVVTGSVTENDGIVVTELVLVDTVSGLPKGREQLDAASTMSFQTRLPATVDNLFAAVHQTARLAVPDEVAPRAFDDVPVLAGNAFAAVFTGGLVALTAIAFVSFQVIGLVALAPASMLYLASLAGLVLTPFVVGGAFAIAALAADAIAGAPVSFLRAGIAALVTFAVVALLEPLVVLGTSGATAIVAFQVANAAGVDATRLPEYPELLPSIVGAGVVLSMAISTTVAASALGVGLATFALTEDAPSFGEE